MTNNDLSIRQITHPQDIERFIRFPFHVYSGDPNWVPQLLSEQRKGFDPTHNPYYDHADVALWLAERDGKVVGTITSHIDHLHQKVHQDKVGMFGFFETIEDYTVAQALLDTASDWVRDRGMTALRGPLSFSQNHIAGLLVEGEPGHPVVMMAYNPPYYTTFLERYGFSKAMDLYAYWVDLSQFEGDPEGLPKKLRRVSERVKSNTGITVRAANLKDFEGELQRAKAVYNQAWEKNWGFVPLTDAETDKLAADLKQILDPNLVLVAEVGERPVGVSITIPDVNQVFRRVNGRLFPFGWLKALWYLRKVDGVRLMILGVVEDYRGKGIEAVMIYESLKAAIAQGYHHFEFSWILENNDMMNRIIMNLGEAHDIRRYRTYRLYQIDI
jgi:GNAT superfamily N-acetyltransferase